MGTGPAGRELALPEILHKFLIILTAWVENFADDEKEFLQVIALEFFEPSSKPLDAGIAHTDPPLRNLCPTKVIGKTKTTLSHNSA
jgi:hypothetical protein